MSRTRCLFLSWLSITSLACSDITVSAAPEREGDDPGECTDGADNDFDGDFDCDDSDCANSNDCSDGDDDTTGDDDDSATGDDDDTAGDDDDSATGDDDDTAGDDDDTAGDDDDSTPPPSSCPDGNCALRFDGIDDYLWVAHDSSLTMAATGLTVEAWVFYDQISSGCMTVARKGISASATQEYWLHKNIDPADSTHWAGPNWSVTSFSAVSAGLWIHYAGVYDPSNNETRTYFNGTVHSTDAAGGTSPSTGEAMHIGVDWDFACPMDGVIDELRLSSVARYNANFVPTPAFVTDLDTMALYHFDENSGGTAYDSSGNGNHAQIFGASWTTESP